jgi:hypothetical protein
VQEESSHGQAAAVVHAPFDRESVLLCVATADIHLQGLLVDLV